jgi:hypothetical protein
MVAMVDTSSGALTSFCDELSGCEVAEPLKVHLNSSDPLSGSVTRIVSVSITSCVSISPLSLYFLVVLAGSTGQAFSAITATKEKALLFAIDSDSNRDWSYDPAGSNTKWTKISGGLAVNSVAVSTQGDIFAVSIGLPGSPKGEIYKLGDSSPTPTGAQTLSTVQLVATAPFLVVRTKDNDVRILQSGESQSWTDITTPDNRPWAGAAAIAYGGSEGILARAGDHMDVSADSNASPRCQIKCDLDKKSRCKTVWGGFSTLPGVFVATAQDDLQWFPLK